MSSARAHWCHVNLHKVLAFFFADLDLIEISGGSVEAATSPLSSAGFDGLVVRSFETVVSEIDAGPINTVGYFTFIDGRADTTFSAMREVLTASWLSPSTCSSKPGNGNFAARDFYAAHTCADEENFYGPFNGFAVADTNSTWLASGTKAFLGSPEVIPCGECAVINSVDGAIDFDTAQTCSSISAPGSQASPRCVAGGGCGDGISTRLPVKNGFRAFSSAPSVEAVRYDL